MESLRVLVVEDNAMIGILLAEMLEEMGHEVCAIESTEAGAVAAAIRCHPQLMIVDVGLGGGSGVTAVDEIFRTGAVPHVFISGDISRIKVLRPSAIALQKPFREPELVRAIQRALGAEASPSISLRTRC